VKLLIVVAPFYRDIADDLLAGRGPCWTAVGAHA
jgi:6,7-dimethyl-8-ribityllumazine synthase